MRFISGYVWQGERAFYGGEEFQGGEASQERETFQGELQNQDALLLQQVRYRGCPILFACICSGNPAGGYITGQLIQWFYARGMHFCRKAFSDEKLEKELLTAWKQVSSEAEQFSNKIGCSRNIHMTAILISCKRFWLLWKGNGRGYLLNRRFHRPHIRLLTGESTLEGEHERLPEAVSGSLQRGLGILLCGGDFSESLPTEVIRDCLAVQEIETQQQISRRLKELQGEGCKRSGMRAGSAVYVKIQ